MFQKKGVWKKLKKLSIKKKTICLKKAKDSFAS